MAIHDSAGQRDLYAHRGYGASPAVLEDSPCVRASLAAAGTNNPSRLFFASLFATRSHADETISVTCVTLQELIDRYEPSVVKMDCEGAERFLQGVEDFRKIRRLVVEWDWTHNRQRRSWEEVRDHLEFHGFKLQLRGSMPDFEAGEATLQDARRKKRGNTGMIFVASRKVDCTGSVPRCGYSEDGKGGGGDGCVSVFLILI
eukprot:Skav214269  [mRNA]  locus=scaffold642:81879:84436:+ [translate_table: standard]